MADKIFERNLARPLEGVCSGLQRTVEQQGRISLPTEYRKIVGICAFEFVEIWCSANLEIIVRRYKKRQNGKIRGVLRKVSNNGQICVPIEFRRWLGIVPTDKVEIFLYSNDEIRIKKFTV